MTLQQTMTVPPRHQSASAGPPDDESSAELLAQAQAFAEVARAAAHDCQRGTAAAEELNRRRNRSGQ